MATQAPTPRLRGREVELQALGDAFDRVASGHLTAVIVEGEAGIGKTRLLADALDGARGRGLQVVAGRAQELKFRHDLLHEAIYTDLPAGVRLALHREAGRRLADSGAEALAVAEHLVRGAGSGDDEAIAWLTRAARRPPRGRPP
jgi:predicted ATPase